LVTAVRERSVLEALAGEGEMAELIRAHDWAATPVGAPETWSPALRTTLAMLMRNRFPMLLWWGPQLVQFYNDAYKPIPGDKHPTSVGQPAHACWPEIWDVIGPMIRTPFAGGDATASDDLPLFVVRNGFPEETHFKMSYSPVPDDTAPDGIGGVLATVSEVTAQVYAERQLRTLRELGIRVTAATSTEQALVDAARTFGENRADLPFTALYLLDHDELRLVAASPAVAELPEAIAVGGLLPTTAAIRAASASPGLPGRAAAPEALRRAIETRTAQPIDDVGALIAAVPASPWGTPVGAAIALPLAAPDQPRCYGVMIAGVSPHRAVDDLYRSFFDLAAAQVVAAIRNARAHEEARARAEALAELDRAKTAFFSNISHELRTPLTLLLGPTEDALAGGGALAGEPLAMVHRNELRLAKLVDTLLDFARIEAGRAQAVYVRVDVAALTAELASQFRAAIDKAGLRLVVDASQPVAGYVDPEMWEKIVLNLVSNALKHTFEGEIAVAVRATGDDIVLAVRDTGVGIPPLEQARVFERFYRVRNARSRSHEGTGIGLALVRDLVRLHGGRISVVSELGRGTMFEVSVPAGRGHLPADHVDVVASPQRPAARAFVSEALSWLPSAHPPTTATPARRADQAARVLVVDDNVEMRAYLARLLGEHWTVDTAADGEAALAHVRAIPPDLVVSDVMMPSVDGLALIAALRGDPATAAIPVILLSARAGEEATADGLRAGADDYIVKPFTASALVVRIEAQLAAARARKRAAAEAVAERDRLAELLREAPAAVCAVRGADLVIEFVNPRVLAAWGKSADIVGKPLAAAFPELADRPFLDQLRRVMATGTPLVGTEVRPRIARWLDRYFDYACVPIRDPGGAISGVLIFSIDVTDKVIAHRELETALQDARAANRAKDEFLALLGHELRNPLAPIITAVELMELRGYRDVAAECAVIGRQAEHLMQLVADLMDASRIAHGRVDLHREPVGLADVIAKSVEMATPLLEQKRHHLALAVADDLVVDGDRHRLAQVFSNLLVNAAKYTDAGGHIEVSAVARGHDAVVSVRDTGIGIAADALPQVFEMFVQEPQASDRARGGLGLGLAIVSSLVAAHGGTVSATSDGQGRGSTFEVRLPRLIGAAPRARAATARLTPGATGHRVMIVEDNADAAYTLSRTLDALGHHTAIAGDGPSALDLADRFRPDIALLDIGLPVMDGYAVAHSLRDRARSRDIRLVAITGYGQPGDVARSTAAGFDAHLIKPIDVNRLARLIDDLLGSSARGEVT
jgi:signal transduction histidine kinase